MLYSFAEKRAALLELRVRNKDSQESRHHYRVNRFWTDLYFSDSQLYKWQTEIRGFASNVRSIGQPVLHLDVCGNTIATRMGFDHSFQVSMQDTRLAISKATSYRADIFTRQSLKPILEEITRENGQLTLTTFQPKAGLQSYMTLGQSEAYRDVIYHRLYQQLELIVKATRIGGYIHLERPFQMDESMVEFLRKTPPNKQLSHVTLKAWARKLQCSIRLHYDSFGHKWLLRKDYKNLVPTSPPI